MAYFPLYKNMTNRSMTHHVRFEGIHVKTVPNDDKEYIGIFYGLNFCPPVSLLDGETSVGTELSAS